MSVIHYRHRPFGSKATNKPLPHHAHTPLPPAVVPIEEIGLLDREADRIDLKDFAALAARTHEDDL